MNLYRGGVAVFGIVFVGIGVALLVVTTIHGGAAFAYLAVQGDRFPWVDEETVAGLDLFDGDERLILPARLLRSHPDQTPDGVARPRHGERFQRP